MNQQNFSTADNPPSTAALRTAGTARLAAVALLLGGAAFGAFAQYKVVGPDGSVTYTDKPPAANTARPAGNGAAAGATGGGAAGLPFETRQAAAKYPVTLYAAKGCGPCDSARQWLRTRGIPFSEYSVDNDKGIAQLQQRFGNTTVPVITIGGQTVVGFSTSDMQSYADAAGYPAQARLAGYTWPAAVPLVPNAAAVPVAATPKAAAPAPAADPPRSASGIQF